MRKVIFSTFNFAPAFLGPTLNVVQTEIDAGHEVFFITCLKSFKSCGFNTYGLKYMCELCSYRLDKGKKHLKGKHNVIKLTELIQPEDLTIARAFMTGNSVVNRDLYYGVYDVGESVLSSYISKTRDRDMELLIDQGILTELAFQSITVFLAVKRFLQANAIDEVMIFNGRWDYYRAVYRAVNELHIPCNIFENLRPGGFIEFYGNNFPHIILNKQRKYDQLWANEEPELVKKKIASQYFEKKRNGEIVIGKSYTKHQTRFSLPVELADRKEVLVIFNSSDDEFAAVAGDEYKNPYFSSQTEGILYVADLIAKNLPNKFLVIRMHPNLTGVNFQYVRSLYELKGKYNNVVLLEPESLVDSYALIEVAEKVITFGSSIGVEANYWRKPVVLLGKPFYYYSDVAYLPKDRAEILSLLTQDLKPKPIEHSEKIGYYNMRGGIKAPYYEYQFGVKYMFKDWRIDFLPFLVKNYFRLLRILKIKNN